MSIPYFRAFVYPPPSPCVGTAALLPWMSEAALDLRGKPRLYGVKPDMGATECNISPATSITLR